MEIKKGEWIGSLAKTFGTSGQIVLKFNSDYFEILQKAEQVLIDINNQPVPFFIENIEFRNTSSALIKFLDYDNENQVLALVGNKIFLTSKSLVQKKPSFLPQSFKGFIVQDTVGVEIGIVKAFIEYPNNSVIQVIQGKKEILIPVNEQIIRNIDKKKRVISVSLPDGLLNLND